MKLIKLPEKTYEDYKIDLMFDCYKWDPVFLDNNTVAKYALVITQEEYKELKELTEKIDLETIKAEEYINNNNIHFAKKLNLPKIVFSELKNMTNYDAKNNVRLMRYDFHMTIDEGWKVSEVNSDVPGGFAESTLMPSLAIKYLNGENKYYRINFIDYIINQIEAKVKKGGRIMFIHCTCYSDDRQCMQCLGDKLKEDGYEVIYGAADHLKFENNKAISILSGNEGEVDFIFRFTPLEWLKDVKPKRWGGYFNTITPSCNHPISIFAQTKRFPLIWDELEKEGLKFDTWRKLLPETFEVKNMDIGQDYIFKPSCGRVGEKISIKEACIGNEYEKILNDVKKHKNEYIVQKKFKSKPIEADDGKSYHVCLGSYTVNSLHAGFYARISSLPRIDSNAADVPVIIEKGE